MTPCRTGMTVNYFRKRCEQVRWKCLPKLIIKHTLITENWKKTHFESKYARFLPKTSIQSHTRVKISNTGLMLQDGFHSLNWSCVGQLRSGCQKRICIWILLRFTYLNSWCLPVKLNRLGVTPGCRLLDSNGLWGDEPRPDWSLRILLWRWLRE